MELLRVRYSLAFIRALEEKGIDGRSIWSDSGLAANVLEDPEAWMPVKDLSCFLEAAVRKTGWATLGLDAGIAPRRQHSQFSLRLLLSPSLYETLSSVCRLASQEDTSAHWRLVREGPFFWMQCQHEHGSEEGVRQIEFFRYACMLEIVRFATDEDWLPQHVDFQSSIAPDVTESPYLSGAAVRFDMPCMQLAIPPLLLSRPMHGIPSVPLGRSRFTAQLDKFESTLLELVRYQILSGKGRLEDAAQALGLSRRSLQRRLSNQGITYTGLLQKVRIDTAMVWLSDGVMSISGIAARLGYGESTNFSRAFRKKCGVPPREFRRLVNGQKLD